MADYTPLHEACEFGHIETVKKILADKKKKHAWLNSADRRSCTPLLYAASARDLEIMKLLLKAGASPQITTKSNTSLFHFIARVKEPVPLLNTVLKMLAEKNVSVDAVNVNKITPLMEACLYGSIPCVRFFLETGAKKNLAAVNRFGENALHAACRGGNLEVIKLLLENGAPWNAVGNEGTPAQVAFKSFEVLEPERVKAIAKVFADATGKTVMHTTFHSRCPEDRFNDISRLFSEHFECEPEPETNLLKARKGLLRDICLWILYHCSSREAENIDLSALLLLHSLYCTSAELANVLIQLSQDFESMSARFVNASGFALRLVHFTKQWLGAPFTSDDRRAELAARMKLQDTVVELVPGERLFIMTTVIPLNPPRAPSGRWTPTNTTTFEQDKEMLTTLKPSVIAMHMTAIESEMCADIAPTEFIRKRWEKKETAPYLYALVDRTNLISGWVTFTVLNWGKDRAHAVKIFVKIARRLHRVHNYNCCAAVVTGLRCLPVARLKHLLASLSTKVRTHLEHLELCYSPMSNYAAYRKMNMAPPAIPILAVMFKDLTAIQETAKPYCDEENKVINFEMMLQIERSVRGFYAKNTAYGIEEDEKIHEWLLNIAPPPTADELYQQSLEIEPLRNTKTVDQQLRETKTKLEAVSNDRDALQKRLDAGLTVLDLLIQSDPDNRALKAVKNALQGQFVVDLASVAENAVEDLIPVTHHRSMTMEGDAAIHVPSRKGPPPGNRGTVAFSRRRPPPALPPGTDRSVKFVRSSMSLHPRARMTRTKSDEAPAAPTQANKIVPQRGTRRPRDC